MEKPRQKKSKAPARQTTVGGYKILGTTSDGVKILKPRTKATHFTDKELREAIMVVRQFRGSKSDYQKG